MSARSESRKMTKTVQVRATPTEKDLLKARADAYGISVGELCRRTIFGARPKAKTDLAAIHALSLARADLGRLGGLLKGWLAGAFPAAPRPEQQPVRELLHQVEAAQNVVIQAVKVLGGLL